MLKDEFDINECTLFIDFVPLNDDEIILNYSFRKIELIKLKHPAT